MLKKNKNRAEYKYDTTIVQLIKFFSKLFQDVPIIRHHQRPFIFIEMISEV